MLSRRVQVNTFQDGTALPILAREHCESFLKMLGSTDRLAPARRITVGTACTGSAADLLSFLALGKAYRQHVPAFEVAYLFNCESSRTKQKWGMTLHGLCPEAGGDGGSCCCFRDIGTLHAGRASCWVHNKGPEGCQVPAVDIFVCATSCNDFSRINSQKHKRTLSGGGESARTLSGMNRYLDEYRPPLFLFLRMSILSTTHHLARMSPRWRWC